MGTWGKPIEVIDYDPQWPLVFAEIAAHVRAVFEDGLPVRIEHVGSTSILGLPAKPIVDIDVVIPSRADLADAIAQLATLGYVHQGDGGIPGREAFRSPPEPPCHHLYVCAQDNAELHRHLAFRDFLRAHPVDAKRYGELKRELAAHHGADIDAYVEGKTAFVKRFLRKREAERQWSLLKSWLMTAAGRSCFSRKPQACAKPSALRSLR